MLILKVFGEDLKKFFKDFIHLFLGRGEERKRGRETSMCGCLSCAPYWEPGPQPGMCPNWESNQRPFGSQAGTQSTEPHQPGQDSLFLTKIS